MSIKVKVGGSRQIRAVPKQGTTRSIVALGEKKPLITPDSVTLGIDTIGNYIASANAGAGIVITPEQDSESLTVLIRHANTSAELDSTNNSVLGFTTNIDIDNFGHITGFTNSIFNANNFSASDGIISSDDFTIGTTSFTLGDTTTSLAGLTSFGVGELTLTQGRITGSDDIVISPTTGGVVDMDSHRVVGVSNPIDDQDVVTLSWLDSELDALTISLRVIADPTDPTDATNKRYVDNLVQGLRVRPSMLAATTADLGGTYDAGNTSIASTITLPAQLTIDIDGVTNWDSGSRLLVKNQTNADENGAYEVTTVGDGSTQWVFTRTDFSNESEEIPGSYHFVTDGDTYSGTGWVATVTDAETFALLTDDITYTQFQGEGTFTAGVGLTLTGTQFSVNENQEFDTITANGGILTIDGDALTIPTGQTSDRPTPATGMIRFNTTDSQFEGYDGVAWAGLGGVIDVDQDTKIEAENSPGSDNDQLKFFTGDVQRFIIDNASMTANVDVIIDTTGALTLPNGSTADRPTAEQGMVRFNTSDNQFEGYDGTAWAGLGGVIDVDQDTYIKAETSPGGDNDQLDFYVANNHVMRLDSDGDLKFGQNLEQFVVDYATGTVTIRGNITIGDGDDDSINVIADFGNHLIANTHNTYDLGTSSKNWRTLYAQNIGSANNIVTFDSTGAIVLPIGTTAERPYATQGMIRYNTTDGRFESYDGANWGGLAGSVIDVDQDTYIIAESSPNADDDRLQFYTANTEAFVVTNNQVITTTTGDLKLDAASGNIDVGGSTITNAGNLFKIREDSFVPGTARELDAFNSPIIELGEGLEEVNYDSANNSIQIRLTDPGATPGTYGNDGFTPRIRIDATGRVEFATEVPVELQANAIPDFTETSRDIIADMFVNGTHNGITIVNDDANNVINVSQKEYTLEISGAITGTVQVDGSNTELVTTADGFDFLRTVEAGDGISISHTLGANTVATISHNNTSNHSSVFNSGGTVIQDLEFDDFGHVTDSDSVDLDLRYVTLAGNSTVAGDLAANRFVDAQNTTYYADPGGTSRFRSLEIGFGLGASQIEMEGSQGTAYIYTNGRNIGFLDSAFNFAAYADKNTGHFYVQNGNMYAEKFVDNDAQTYFLHPGGTDSLIKKITLDDSLVVDNLTLDGNQINSDTGVIDMGSNRLSDVTDPTNAQDAATKAYVDAVAQGLRVIPSALAATTANLSATYNNSAGTLTSTVQTAFEVDGVTDWSVGDLVLVKDQTSSLQNGTYEVTTVGDGSTEWVLTRNEWFNESSEIPGSFQFVTDGTTNNGTGWVVTVTDAENFALGTSAITWYQFSGAGTYTAGDGLDLTGTEFSIADDGVTNAMLANPSFTIIDENSANTTIALGESLTFQGTDGVDTTVTAGQVAIAVTEIDGGSF